MSAILKVTRSIENDIWKITFSVDTLKFSEADKQLIAKFGEPEINVGGSIEGPEIEGTSINYTLPDRYIKIRSGLPFTQEFDSKSEMFQDYTKEKALRYQDAFTARYTTAIENLRSNQDSFSGEYLINL